MYFLIYAAEGFNNPVEWGNILSPAYIYICFIFIIGRIFPKDLYYPIPPVESISFEFWVWASVVPLLLKHTIVKHATVEGRFKVAS